jgi:hypothetical protein
MPSRCVKPLADGGTGCMNGNNRGEQGRDPDTEHLEFFFCWEDKRTGRICTEVHDETWQIFNLFTQQVVGLRWRMCVCVCVRVRVCARVWNLCFDQLIEAKKEISDLTLQAEARFEVLMTSMYHKKIRSHILNT